MDTWLLDYGQFAMFLLTLLLYFIWVYLLARVQREREICEQLKREMRNMTMFNRLPVGSVQRIKIAPKMFKFLLREQLLCNYKHTMKSLHKYVSKHSVKPTNRIKQ